MTETTWRSATAMARPARPMHAFGRVWRERLLASLHRALDAGLRAGELAALDTGTLADIGYRRD